MKRLLTVLAILLAVTARADMGSLSLTFGGRAASPSVVVDPGTNPGDVLWDSGPSDPLSEAASAILFQGLALDSGISIEASVGTGSTWGPWISAWTERFPNGRFWGKVTLAAPAGSSLRLRVVHRGIATYGTVEIYSFAALGYQAEAMHIPEFSIEPSTDVPKPQVRSREDWGAAAPKRPYTPMRPKRFTVHHTVGAQPTLLDDSIQEMLIIQRFHQAGRGWNDIGYHFLIDGAGRVFQGRPENVYGAHARGHNKGNIGISLMGCFHEPRDQKPTEMQMGALVTLGRWITRAYTIDPQTLKGHRDLGPTSCPGDNLYPRLPEVRQALADALLASAGAGPALELARAIRTLTDFAASVARRFETRR